MDAISRLFFQLDVNYGSFHVRCESSSVPDYPEEPVRPVRFGGPDSTARALHLQPSSGRMSERRLEEDLARDGVAGARLETRAGYDRAGP